MENMKKFPLVLQFGASIFLVVFLLAVITTPALADFRLATVDVNKVINEIPEAKTKKDDLDKRSAELRKQIEDRSKNLKALEKKIQEDNLAEGSKEVENYRNERKSVERFIKDHDEELKKEFVKINRSLAEKAIQSIQAFAKKNNYDLVLDRSDKVRGPVLYGNEGNDITSEVIKALQ